MATTIGGYNVSIGLSAGGYIDTAKAVERQSVQMTAAMRDIATPTARIESSMNQATKAVELERNEMTQLNRLMRDSITPMERYQQRVELIEKAVQSQAITQERANRLLDVAGQKYAKAVPVVTATVVDEKQVKTIDRLNDSVSGLATRMVGVAAAAASFHTVKEAAQGVIDRVKVLDAGLKKAASIDADFNQLQRFIYIADNIANIDSGAAVNMLTKLTKNIGEASLAGDKAGKHFADLGLSVEKLNSMSAVEQFEAVATAIRKVESPSERAAYAVKFFGKQGVDLVPMLTAASDELEQASDRFNELTYGIDALDAQNIAIAADAMADLGRAADSVKSKFAAELAPTMTAFANDMTNQSIQFREGATDIRGLGFAFKFAADGVRNMLMQATGTKAFLETLKAASQIAAPFADNQAEAQRSAALDEKLKQANARIQVEMAGGVDPAKDAEAAAEQAKITKEYEKQADALQHQVNILERGESVAEQIRLSEAGYTDEQIEQIVNLQQKLDLLEEQKKVAEDIARKEAEASREAARNAEQTQKDIEKQASDLERSLMTPIEAVADKLNELKYLFEVDEAISQQTFDRAKEKLLSEAVKDIKIEAPKNLEVGSQEAYKFFSQRDNRAQEAAIRAERKQEVERQVNATNRVADEVRDLKNNIKRKR